jgi:hypothetical protein
LETYEYVRKHKYNTKITSTLNAAAALAEYTPTLTIPNTIGIATTESRRPIIFVNV